MAYNQIEYTQNTAKQGVAMCLETKEIQPRMFPRSKEAKMQAESLSAGTQ